MENMQEYLRLLCKNVLVGDLSAARCVEYLTFRRTHICILILNFSVRRASLSVREQDCILMTEAGGNIAMSNFLFRESKLSKSV
jgi:hypothetical protein